ncbi:MAG TPA: rod-binding protein [Bryobacteraceae bacterium]|jgi:Rod binding domain-containing protein|nr:rod-binding protein [Bryobacteraceae bacterium]
MTIGAMMPAMPAPSTKVEGAAKQFEALMIAQMLRTARENTEDQDSSGSTMLDMADQQFSQVLANNGGFGLAKLVVNGINQGQKNADNK